MAIMLVSFGIIGYFVFSGWFSSSKEATESVAGELNEHIYKQIFSYMLFPAQINEVNHKIIANGMVDFSDEATRDRYFVGVLSSYSDAISGISYATADGEYYGARRNANGVFEIIRSNFQTGGQIWYYNTTDDNTAGEVAEIGGAYDMRQSEWYTSAVERSGPGFTDIHRHYLTNKLVITYSCPLYNQDGSLNGVLGTHMLLNDISLAIDLMVREYTEYVILIDKETQKIIANSKDALHYRLPADDMSEEAEEMLSLDELDTPDIRMAYDNFLKTQETSFFYKGINENWYMDVKELELGGLNWVVISALPESYLLSPAFYYIYLAIILAIVFLALSLFINILLTSRMLKPLSLLREKTAALAAGDLYARAEVKRNDEIGQISRAFNFMADELQTFVWGLEKAVKDRTIELENAYGVLEENTNRLQLILDSAAEAIFGIDTDGKCTFCNKSCVAMLGYMDQSELLGKDIHNIIHHTNRDSSPSDFTDCRILRSIERAEGVHADDEVFWRADGTCFDVEYHSYPQIKNGQVVGAVITFTDITIRKQREAEIQFLYCFDTLTGLLNRRCFEEKRLTIDIPENLPLSVIFADINGLKLTNDVFGHNAGDELIKKSAEILKQACRSGDVIARTGGDEFIILLPKTTAIEAAAMLNVIKSSFAEATVEAVKCSISMGTDTKYNPGQSLDEVMANAENAMYKDKTINRSSINKDIVDTIIQTLHKRSRYEQLHSINVQNLSAELGKALNMPKTELVKLKRAAYLHDIGKIVLDYSLLNKNALDIEEQEKFKQHSVVGYRILNLIDETLDLAEYVYSHHEKWDGKGYPRGLKGEQIPLISRIISLTETYDRVYRRTIKETENYKQVSLEIIKEAAGSQFDPELTSLFLEIAENIELQA